MQCSGVVECTTGRRGGQQKEHSLSYVRVFAEALFYFGTLNARRTREGRTEGRSTVGWPGLRVRLVEDIMQCFEGEGRVCLMGRVIAVY